MPSVCLVAGTCSETTSLARITLLSPRTERALPAAILGTMSKNSTRMPIASARTETRGADVSVAHDADRPSADLVRSGGRLIPRRGASASFCRPGAVEPDGFGNGEFRHAPRVAER